jgi:alkylhydroperoxidase family enzyme
VSGNEGLARRLVAGADDLAASPREQALAALGVALTHAPWALEPATFANLAAAGVSREGVEQAITVAAFFNYFTRVADGTGIEFDYESPLPRIAVDRAREPVERPERSAWPAGVDGSTLPVLPHRPRTQAAIERWRAYALDRDEPLSRRDRLVLARAAAEELCDAGAVARWDNARPRDAREQALADYAAKLTRAPWQVGAEDLAPLRARGLDDPALLCAIALVAQQNAVSRLHHALAALGAP